MDGPATVGLTVGLCQTALVTSTVESCQTTQGWEAERVGTVCHCAIETAERKQCGIILQLHSADRERRSNPVPVYGTESRGTGRAGVTARHVVMAVACNA